MKDQQFYAVLNKSMPDYTPVEKIGAGSFGSVFKCERDNIFYAIKIISVPPNEDELQMLLSRADEEEVREYLSQKVENYRREIKLMAELKGNRNIVNIEDYKIVEAEESLGYYIVIRMELLTSLTSYTSKHMLTRDEIIQIGIDICDALIICEKHNVIHRDIKPENIMIHNDGAYKLGDFGVAKQLSKTTMGTIAGTEGFMAPEVSRGQEYNHTADIYSLGILLYYFLNNRKMPYVETGDNAIVAEQKAIVRRMSTNEILPFPSNTDENLSQIVVKACMYHKDLRYQSAEDMKKDLIMVLHGMDVKIDLEALSETGLRADDEKGTSAGSDEPFGGSIYIPPDRRWGSGGTKDTEEIPKKKPKKKRKGALIAGVVAAIVVLGAAGAGIGYVMQNQPASNIEVQENTVRALTRSEMEEAYTLGLQYYQLGNYENAISELNKVTKKSGKYEDAQATMVAAMTAYKDGLIKKSSDYCNGGDFELALSLLESGTALLGENTDIVAQRQEVLNKLKVDHINKATEAEERNEYAQAFSYIQTALAYLSDDVELQGLYARLDAMATAESAIHDAENYYATAEYAKMFSVLTDTMNDVSDSATASSKVKLKYDEYKKTFLKNVEVQIKNPTTVEEYSRAIDALDVAVTIFPQEYELKTKQESLKLMKVALDGIIKADQYKLDGEDVKMFAALLETRDAVCADEEAYNKVTGVYDTYKNEYMENLNTQIGEPVSVGEYENAILLLEAAVTALPEEYALQSQLMEYQENKPVNMLDCEPVSVYCYVGDGTVKQSVNDDNAEHYFSMGLTVTDNYSNSYENATMLKVGTNDNGKLLYSGTSCDTRVVYDCEGYASLTGTIAIGNAYKNYAGKVAVFIKGVGADDKRTVLYTFNLNNGSKPQQISLDVSNYASVSIELLVYKKIEKDTYYYGFYRNETMGLILSDFTLSK